MYVKPLCPNNCFKCCLNTEMILAPSDIARIEALGYSKDEFAYFDGFFWRLRNINGKCVFLNDKGKCVIYRYRPLGCRAYPVIYVEGLGFTFDNECPAINTLTTKDLAIGKELIRRVLSEYGIKL
ncbi:MAG: YkgJ family cysteine cluster protein [Thermoprotei archaeon]|nr:MAG: YkgJ family cysteine cluster protein [Thermoprotei archaeon]